MDLIKYLSQLGSDKNKKTKPSKKKIEDFFNNPEQSIRSVYESKNIPLRKILNAAAAPLGPSVQNLTNYAPEKISEQQAVNAPMDLAIRPFTRNLAGNEISAFNTAAPIISGNDNVHADNIQFKNPLTQFVFGKDKIEPNAPAAKKYAEDPYIKNPLTGTKYESPVGLHGTAANAAAPILALGITAANFPLFGGGKKKAMEKLPEAIALAKKTETAGKFVDEYGKLSPEAQKAVGILIKDERSPINSLLDFWNKVNGEVAAPATTKPASAPLTAPANLLKDYEKDLDPKQVQKYYEQLQRGEDIGPVKVVRMGDHYGIEDGKHHFAAYQQAGYKDVPIEFADNVKPVTSDEMAKSELLAGKAAKAPDPAQVAPAKSGPGEVVDVNGERVYLSGADWMGVDANGKQVPMGLRHAEGENIWAIRPQVATKLDNLMKQGVTKIAFVSNQSAKGLDTNPLFWKFVRNQVEKIGPEGKAILKQADEKFADETFAKAAWLTKQSGNNMEDLRALASESEGLRDAGTIKYIAKINKLVHDNAHPSYPVKVYLDDVKEVPNAPTLNNVAGEVGLKYPDLQVRSGHVTVDPAKSPAMQQAMDTAKPLDQFMVKRNIGITSASVLDPKLNELATKAQAARDAGDYELAAKLDGQILDAGEKALTELYKDFPDIKITVNRTMGDYWGKEPTFQTSVEFPKTREGVVVRRIADLGRKLKQDTIHISEDVGNNIETKDYGREFADGYSFEPKMYVQFDRKVTPKEADAFMNLLHENGFAGATQTFDGKGFYWYNVSRGEYGSKASNFVKQSEKLIKTLREQGLREGLSGDGKKIGIKDLRRSNTRLLVIGNPNGGATRTYDQIGSYISPAERTAKVAPQGNQAGFINFGEIGTSLTKLLRGEKPQTKPLDESFNKGTDLLQQSDQAPVGEIGSPRRTTMESANQADLQTSTNILPQRGKLNVQRLNVSEELQKLIRTNDKGNPPVIGNKTVVENSALTKGRKTPLTEAEKINRMSMQLNSMQKVVSLTKKMEELKKAGADEKEIKIVLSEIIDQSQVAESEGTFAGQLLQARNIIADELATPMQKIFALMEKAGVSKEQYLDDAAKVDWNNSKQVLQFYRKYVKGKLGDYLTEYRYTNMLSSPLTHIVNTASNTIQSAAIAPVEKTISGIIDLAKSKITGAEREYYVSDGVKYLKGYTKALPEALSKFKKTITGEEVNIKPDMERIPASTGKAWGIYTLPLKALEASDQFFMTLVRGGEAASMQGRGLKDAEILTKADNAAKYRLFRQKFDPSGELGNGYMLRTWDKYNGVVQQLRRVPGGNWIVPFLQTPTNILKQGVEYSPLGILTIPGSKKPVEQLSKTIIGSAVFAGTYAALSSTPFTWDVPKGKKERDLFYAAGMQPYSIKIGDKWVSYSKLGPISYPIAMAASLRYAEKYDLPTDQKTAIATAVGGMLQFFSDQSYVKQLGDFVDAIQTGQGVAAGIQKEAVNMVSQLVPYRSFLSWLSRMTDPVQRKPEGMVESITSQIPGLSQNVGAYYNPITQEESKRSNPVLNSFLPYKTQTGDPKIEKMFDFLGSGKRSYSNIMALPPEQRQAMFQKIRAYDPAMAKEVLKVKENVKLGVTGDDSKLKSLGVDERAYTITQELNDLETNEEKNALWEKYVKMKIITPAVAKQIRLLLKKKQSMAPAPQPVAAAPQNMIPAPQPVAQAPQPTQGMAPVKKFAFQKPVYNNRLDAMRRSLATTNSFNQNLF